MYGTLIILYGGEVPGFYAAGAAFYVDVVLVDMKAKLALDGHIGFWPEERLLHWRWREETDP